MKAIIIDLKETIRDVKPGEELIQMVVNTVSNEIVDEKELPYTTPVKLTKKIYKGIDTAFPKDIKGYSRRERYYLDIEDWKLKIALIRAVIDNETNELRKKNTNLSARYQLLDKLQSEMYVKLRTLENKWYVKLGKKLEIIYTYIRGRK